MCFFKRSRETDQEKNLTDLVSNQCHDKTNSNLAGSGSSSLMLMMKQQRISVINMNNKETKGFFCIFCLTNQVFCIHLFLKNEVQINKNNYGMIILMSKQVHVTKICLILQKNEKTKIGSKSNICPFCMKAFEYVHNNYILNKEFLGFYPYHYTVW